MSAGPVLDRDDAGLLLAVVRRCEQLEARVNRSTGARPPALARLVALLEGVYRGTDDGARFVDEPADPRSAAPSQAVARTADRITIQEAAVVLGHSEQYTRRLARADSFGLVVKLPQSTTVARAEVLAYLATHPRRQPDDDH